MSDFESSIGCYYYLSENHLIGLSAGSEDYDYYSNNGFRRKFGFVSFRGYLFKKFFGEVGLGASQGKLKEEDYISSIYFSPAAKLNLGIEGQGRFLSLFITYSQYHTFSGKKIKETRTGNSNLGSSMKDEIENQASGGTSDGSFQFGVGIVF